MNPVEERQRILVTALSPILGEAGLKVVETRSVGGFPDFSLVPSATRGRPPQLLVFASQISKPDLRMSEVLDRRIEVLESTDRVLAYDRPI